MSNNNSGHLGQERLLHAVDVGQGTVIEQIGETIAQIERHTGAVSNARVGFREAGSLGGRVVSIARFGFSSFARQRALNRFQGLTGQTYNGVNNDNPAGQTGVEKS